MFYFLFFIFKKKKKKKESDSAAYPSNMHVTYELSLMTLLSMSSHNSVDGVPILYLRGHDADFSFVPCSCYVADLNDAFKFGQI